MQGKWRNAMYYVAGFLDAGFFVFFPAIATLTLRKLQSRPCFARIKGRRTLVIADVPMVHQLVEVYVSKLFALSYAIAGLDVHGTLSLVGICFVCFDSVRLILFFIFA